MPSPPAFCPDVERSFLVVQLRRELLGLGRGADGGSRELSFVPGERVSSCRFSKDRSCGGSRWCTLLLSTGLIPGSLRVSNPPPQHR